MTLRVDNQIAVFIYRDPLIRVNYGSRCAFVDNCRARDLVSRRNTRPAINIEFQHSPTAKTESLSHATLCGRHRATCWGKFGRGGFLHPSDCAHTESHNLNRIARRMSIARLMQVIKAMPYIIHRVSRIKRYLKSMLLPEISALKTPV